MLRSRGFAVLLGACCAGCTLPRADAVGAMGTQPLTGDWGGAHAALTLTASGGRIEYDCGQGTLDAPVVPDAAGAFRVSGRHVPGHGGPVRYEAQPQPSQPARYEGVVDGDRMQLHVTSDGQDLGSFVLQRGVEATLMRCY